MFTKKTTRILAGFLAFLCFIEVIPATAFSYAAKAIQDVILQEKETVQGTVLTGTAVFDGIEVVVTAPEDAFPLGTVASVKALEKDDTFEKVSSVINNAEGAADEADILGAFDISFIYEGNEIQPAKGTSVDVQFRTANNVYGRNLNVWHVDDDFEAELVDINRTEKNGITTLQADCTSFSIYAVDAYAAYTRYEFYNENGTIIDAFTQVVKDGDTLLAPEVPDKSEHHIFTGWYVGTDKNNVTDTKFENFKNPVNGTKTIKLFPKFEEVYYIFFMDSAYDGADVFMTQTVTKSDLASTAKIVLNSTDHYKKHEGGTDYFIKAWYYDQALNNQLPTDTDGSFYLYASAITDDVYLYPERIQGYWMYFDSGEGTYFTPTFVNIAEVTANPGTPTCPGYTFLYWSETPNGTEPYTFGTALSGDKTIYAVWKAASNTKYTVVHWLENADNDNFSFYKTEEKYGTTGTTVTGASLTKPTGYDKTGKVEKDENGLIVYRNKSGVIVTAADGAPTFYADQYESATIAGDGSTIVNVYYKRAVYEVKFYNTSKVLIPELTITAKYGSYIGDQWPSRKSADYGANWKVGPSSSTMQAGISVMPLNGFSFYQIKESGSQFYIVFYTDDAAGATDPSTTAAKSASGVTYSKSYNSGTYYFHHVDAFKYSQSPLSITKEDHYDIDGYTWTGGEGRNGSSLRANTPLFFYYTKNTYTINYFQYNGTTWVADNVSVKYHDDLNNITSGSKTFAIEDYIPANALKDTETGKYYKIQDGLIYDFAGWYDNENGYGEPITSDYYTGALMPSHDITLYGVFKMRKIQAVINLVMHGVTGTGDETLENIIVAYGTTVEENVEDLQDLENRLMTYKSGELTWTGWVKLKGYDNDSNPILVPFNMKEKIVSDTEIFPEFVADGTRSVEYNVAGAGGTVPKHDCDFYIGTTAKVLGIDGVIAPAGKVFTGWNTKKDGTGTTYQPNEPIVVGEEDITLYAQWGDTPERATVIYYGNNGTTESYTIKNILANSVIGVIDLNDTAAKAATGCSGYAFTIPAKRFFAGWNTEADGTGDWYLETDGIGAETNFRVDGGVNKLYAQWEYPLSVDIVAKDISVVYDGKSHSATDNGTLIDSVTFYDPNIASSVTIKNGVGGETVAYDATKEELTFTYNGRTWKVTGVTFTNSAITDVGSTKVTAAGPAVVYDIYACEKLNAYYDSSKLTVTKRPVVFTGLTDEKFYTGSTVSITTITPDSGADKGLAEGQTLTGLTYLASGIEEGSYPGAFSGKAKIMSGADDVTANYDITTEPGLLTITVKNRLRVVITGNSDTKTYNGSEQTVTGYTVKYYNKATGNEISTGSNYVTISLTASAAGTNVGTYAMGLTADDVSFVLTAAGVEEGCRLDKSDITVIDGTLTITKKELTITGESATETVTGSEISKSGFTTSGLAGADAVSGLTHTVKGTDLGTYTGGFTGTLKVMNGSTEVTSNYQIKLVPGTLTIKPATMKIKVVVTGNTATYTYDGTEKKVYGYSVAGQKWNGSAWVNMSDKEAFECVVLTGTKEKGRTNAGSDNMGLAFTIADGYELESASDLVVNDGKITIAKASVIISGIDANTNDSDVYAGVSSVYPGLISGHTVDTSNVTYTSSDDAWNSSKKYMDYNKNKLGNHVYSISGCKIKYGSTDVTSNYDITYRDGNVVFYYSKKSNHALSYTVRHYIEGTTTSVYPTEVFYLPGVADSSKDKKNNIGSTIKYYGYSATNILSKSVPGYTVVNGDPYTIQLDVWYASAAETTANDVTSYGYLYQTESEKETNKKSYKGATISANDYVITFYYKAADPTYKTKYFYEGLPYNSADDKSATAALGTKISTFTANTKAGYESTPYLVTYPTITGNADTDVVWVYYKKAAAASYNYSVEYYKDGTLFDTKTGFSAKEGEIVSSYDANVTPGNGYYFKSVTPVTITSTVANNVVKVYYAAKEFGYRVEHYFKDLTGNYVINAALTDYSSAKFASTVNAAEAMKKSVNGFSFKEFNKSSIVIDSTEANNVIKAYYDRTTYGYSIEFYYNGTKDTAKTKTYTGSDKVAFGTILSADDTQIALGAKDGYKYSTTAGSITITSTDANNVIKVYYVSRNDLEYVVHYVNKNTSAKILADKAVKNRTFGETYTESAVALTGYNVESSSMSVTIALSGNEITFKYVPAEYEVTYNYFKDGVRFETTSSSVAYGTVVSSYTDKCPTGCKLSKATASITVTDKQDENVIDVYYVTRTDIEFVVNYFEKGTSTKVASSTTYKGNVYGTVVSSSNVIEEIFGYTFDSASAESIVLAVSGNVINLYYTKKTFNFTVNYFLVDTKVPVFATVNSSALYGTNVSFDKLDKEGYSVSVNSIATTIDEDNKEITFFYTPVKDRTITVHYYLNGTTESVYADKVITSKAIGDIVTQKPMMLSGYTVKASDNAAKSIIVAASGNEITFNYYINVTLTANSATFEYDGEEHSATGFVARNMVTGASMLTGEFTTQNITAGGATAIGVGTYPNQFSANAFTLINNPENPETDKFIVVAVTNGVLNITKRNLYATSESASKDYDGTALTANGFTTEAGQLLPGDVLVVNVVGSQTNAGHSENSFETISDGIVVYSIMRGATDVTEYYDAKFFPGLLTVNKVTPGIVVTGKEIDIVYDGQTHTADNTWYRILYKDIENNEELAGYTISVAFKCEKDGVETAILNADKYDFVITGVRVYSGATEVTENFDILIENGIVDVKAVDLSLKADSAEKPWDGTPLTADGYAITEGAIVPSDLAKFTVDVNGSQTSKGKSDNVLTYEWSDDTTAGNYNVKINYGLLTVFDGDLELDIDMKGVTLPLGDVRLEYLNGVLYTNTAATDDDFDIAYSTFVNSVSGLEDGDVLTALRFGTYKTAGGEYLDNITVTEAVVMRGSEEVVYSLDVTPGDLKITGYTVIYKTPFDETKIEVAANVGDVIESSALEIAKYLPNGYRVKSVDTPKTVSNVFANNTIVVEYGPFEVGYTVNHYLMTSSGTYPATPDYVDNLEGSIDDYTAAEAKTFDHHKAVAFSQEIITADGLATVNIYYALEQVTIDFESNSGSIVSSSLAYYEGKVTKPADPEREGYTFDGWFKDPALKVPFDFDNETVTSNATLYAGWTAVDKVITYDKPETGKLPQLGSSAVKYDMVYRINPNDGMFEGSSAIVTRTIKGDVTISAPTRENYIFMGWKVLIAKGMPYKFTLVALWELDVKSEQGSSGDNIPDKYQRTVDFVVVNGHFTGSTAVKSTAFVTLMDGDKWSVDGTAIVYVPTSSAMQPNVEYTNSGAWDKPLGTTITVTATSDQTYTYTYGTKKTFPVKYNVPEDGQNPVEDKTILIWGEKVKVDPNQGLYAGSTGITVYTITDSRIIHDPTRTNYVFRGWYVSTDSEYKLILTAIWDEDSVSSSGNTPDGIPDKYQRTVYFNVVNGTFVSDGKTTSSAFVTLMNGTKWSVDGSALVYVPTTAQMTPDIAYIKSGAWSPKVGALIKVTSTSIKSFTYTYDTKKTFPVEYAKPVEGKNPETDTKTVQFGDLIMIDPNGGFFEGLGFAAPRTITESTAILDAVRPNYVFRGWNVTSSGTYKYIFTAIWDEDKVSSSGNTPDGIPDKYQRTVEFVIENGHFTGSTAVKSCAFVTLMDGDVWTIDGTAIVRVPAKSELTPDIAYTEIGGWNTTLGTQIVVTKSTAQTFTYTFTTKKTFPVTYNVPEQGKKPTGDSDTLIYGEKIMIDPNGGLYEGSSAVITVEITASTAIADPVREGYVFRGWSKAHWTAGIKYVFTAVWDEDVIGPDEKPDGIPDKYQKVINFIVKNGTFKDTGKTKRVVVVTLMEDDKWRKDGTQLIYMPTIFEMTPNEGYTSTGSWDTVSRYALLIYIFSEETYTYTYTEKKTFDITFPAPSDKNEPEKKTKKAEYGSVVLVDPNGGIYAGSTGIYTISVYAKNTVGSASRNGFVFRGWEVCASEKSTVAFILRAIWDEDKIGPDGNKPDGIPDKYQREVEFIVVNGTFNGTTDTSSKVFVTLKNGDVWSTEGSAAIEVPARATLIPDEKYVNSGAWDADLAEYVTVTIDSPATYTFTFNTVKTFDIDAPGLEQDETAEFGDIVIIDPNGGMYEGSSALVVIEVKSKVEIGEPTREGYIFAGWYLTTPVVQSGTTYVYKALWDEDSIGPDGKSDGIPDKFQKVVTLSVENGAWNAEGDTDDIVIVLTLTKNGECNIDGTAKLNLPEGMKAIDGYVGGSWNTFIPAFMSGNDSAHFVYSFRPDDTPESPVTTDRIRYFGVMAITASLGLAVFVLGRKKKEEDAE